MIFLLRSGNEIYLDGLVIECILSTFKARDLAVLSQVCSHLRAPAQLAAHRALQLLVRRLQAKLLRHCERSSWITQLREWEALETANLVWLQAEEDHTTIVTQDDQRHVKSAHDKSGSGNNAAMSNRMPMFREDAVNGHPAFEFDGASVLKTRPFAQALPQPITIVVVARLRGDTTICDSLGPTYAAAPRTASRAALASLHRRAGVERASRKMHANACKFRNPACFSSSWPQDPSDGLMVARQRPYPVPVHPLCIS